MATIVIKLATVFIGICTAWSSPIFNAINYLSRPAVNQSINLFHKPLNISESATVQMPMKTVASLIGIVAIGVWGYFGVIEQINKHETRLELMGSDLEKNTEFRIKWPRGEMGSLPADSEQFMMIEDLYKTTDKLNKHIENMALNKVNIQFLRKQMDKVLEDIEELKDKNRDMYYNGNGAKQ